MRAIWSVAAVVAVALGGGLVGVQEVQAGPSRVAADQSAEWDGGPFLAATPLTPDTICPAGPSDATCHHHELEVDPAGGDIVTIEIVATDWSDLDVVVFDESGQRVAQAGTGDEVERLVMPAWPGRYTVSVAAWSLGHESGRFTGVATLGNDEVADDDLSSDQSCAGSVPDVPVDPATPLSLDVLALLDGITLDRATAIVERGKESWDDIGVELSVTFDDTFSASSWGVGTDFNGDPRPRAASTTMFEEARAHVGGTVPGPHDAVIVLTDKDLNDWGYEFMGVAQCLGALGSPWHAFALGEAWVDQWGAPFGLQTDLSSVIFSHELGHLANAPHHYGECTYGVGRADAGDGSHLGQKTCSLMQYIGPPGSSKFTTASLYFSHLNAVVVRAHIANHAE